ncbi:MAG: hypothetical protein A2898_04675 [Candidatus Kerfeldbacteria bacterium RIFCSPLOWO2_01_FULL_48_11]|uniref:Phosphoglycerate mutase n=1 Tax=Candidatus Kerfeldbacteria bacterium RIFCSPLOWO2_01_FULL_48_11 TaxID=1798543 RepID=A0A1G2B0Z3_9BACT|nr:MAG: Phosphoglycerate mutase [Parcubacteria group bacterium GW2011_GWA2_48_9]KKW16654.1 MAG: Phosphoglycerate mutase [Parcubacteria group bacterium GW2011_GWC2_49_9]OGY82853.1 MAG: hypothetical protein A2898_04675 [Candidatus Kerfeldbacteria bacterium RIFCSPLOWO2_01_FULL_48_11]HCJ52410.1 histidine phosphatase family protein [Candidatus Kerfeldbacteria bacterium]HCM68285.1 histidine phosphatase family protein [Candidatus Kerfeldbacteria bacterium]
MVTIIFESHGTTFDNEAGLSSGLYDVGLSPRGEREAKELGRRRSHERFDAIFCSDLRRSWKTAQVAFGETHSPIFNDARLQECDYGDLTRRPSSEVEAIKNQYVHSPFPNGESYEEVSARIKSFLEDLLNNFDDKKVLIIGHRATQYGLQHLIQGVSLDTVVTAPWSWQPGWEYQLKRV